MSYTCCPVPTAIASVVTTLNPCPADFGQIQKLIFWRSGNTFVTTNIGTITYWTAITTATGATKAVVSPFVGNVELKAGNIREWGSANEVPFGIPYRKGRNPSKFKAEVQRSAQSVISLLKALECENLEVLFINESNQLGYNSLVTTYFGGFPIKSFAVGDLTIGGFNNADINEILFDLPQNWSDSFAISTATTFLLSMVNT
jgi:hypothetical protein